MKYPGEDLRPHGRCSFRSNALGLVLLAAAGGDLFGSCAHQPAPTKTPLETVADQVAQKPCPVGAPANFGGVTLTQVTNQKTEYTVNQRPAVKAFAEHGVDARIDVNRLVAITGAIGLDPGGNCAVKILGIQNQ